MRFTCIQSEYFGVHTENAAHVSSTFCGCSVLPIDTYRVSGIRCSIYGSYSQSMSVGLFTAITACTNDLSISWRDSARAVRVLYSLTIIWADSVSCCLLRCCPCCCCYCCCCCCCCVVCCCCRGCGCAAAAAAATNRSRRDAGYEYYYSAAAAVAVFAIVLLLFLLLYCCTAAEFSVVLLLLLLSLLYEGETISPAQAPLSVGTAHRR